VKTRVAVAAVDPPEPAPPSGDEAPPSLPVILVWLPAYSDNFYCLFDTELVRRQEWDHSRLRLISFGGSTGSCSARSPGG
jgi:hypothetical protein